VLCIVRANTLANITAKNGVFNPSLLLLAKFPSMLYGKVRSASPAVQKTVFGYGFAGAGIYAPAAFGAGVLRVHGRCGHVRIQQNSAYKKTASEFRIYKHGVSAYETQTSQHCKLSFCNRQRVYECLALNLNCPFAQNASDA
jgi:hypothetical protein